MISPATTPKPPYYAVLFTSIGTEGDNGYADTAKEMLALASTQPGFIGFETARQEPGITVSYWATPEAIKSWKENVIPRQARARARSWYSMFRVRVCRVEREYGSRILPNRHFGSVRQQLAAPFVPAPCMLQVVPIPGCRND